MRNAKLTPCFYRGKFGVTVEEIWGSPAGRLFRVPVMTVLCFRLMGTVCMMRSVRPVVACPSCLPIDYVLSFIHCTSSNRRQHSRRIGGDVLSFRSAYAATPLCYPLFLSAVIHCLRTFGSPSFNVIVVYRIVPFTKPKVYFSFCSLLTNKLQIIITATNSTPAIGHTIQLRCQSFVMKLQPKKIAVATTQ